MPNFMILGLSVRKKTKKYHFLGQILPNRSFWQKNRTDKDKKILKTVPEFSRNDNSIDISLDI